MAEELNVDVDGLTRGSSDIGEQATALSASHRQSMIGLSDAETGWWVRLPTPWCRWLTPGGQVADRAPRCADPAGRSYREGRHGSTVGRAQRRRTRTAPGAVSSVRETARNHLEHQDAQACVGGAASDQPMVLEGQHEGDRREHRGEQWGHRPQVSSVKMIDAKPANSPASNATGRCSAVGALIVVTLSRDRFGQHTEDPYSENRCHTGQGAKNPDQRRRQESADDPAPNGNVPPISRAAGRTIAMTAAVEAFAA